MTRTGDGLPPAPGDLAAVKRALRAEMVARRRGLDPAVLAAAHRAAAAHFLATLDPPAGTVVAAYWATAEEFDAGPLIEALLERGCIVALPVVERRNAPLLFRRWRSGEPLVPAGFGLKVPDPAAPVAVPELLAVPLLAFDAAGYRL
ncbi:MAG TPA: 5-formyltetrahydrofolate cyclo-ligase, partial [Alphaproteobacteria bacterium]|nr:5-formyltetrahydrofolate cyclo-ligase [Alphaproteobacteria bacterium]